MTGDRYLKGVLTIIAAALVLLAWLLLRLPYNDARASGGWVLWTQLFLQGGASSDYAPVSGHESHAECYRALRGMTDLHAADDKSRTVTFSCFPSDFDPRGRK